MNYTFLFKQLKNKDVAIAGGKGANLGEMTGAGFPVPDGFVLATDAYKKFVKKNNLQKKIVSIASKVSKSYPESSEKASKEIKKLFLDAPIPKDIEEVILNKYGNLGTEKDIVVAVRSSATAEDLPGASFAGQQETYLHIFGNKQLLEAVKKCWASLWTARAIMYRIKQNIKPDDVSLAVVVQQQIFSDVSGIAFSLNPQNNYYDEVVINSSFGLGESIVSGQVTPDSFVVDKIKKEIVQKQISNKEYMLVGKKDGGIEEQKISDPKAPSLTNEQVLEVSELVSKVEEHYKIPMDIEWAIYESKLYLLQARPITSYLPIFPEMLTKPGEKKKIYIDMIILTQGFSESMSVLGMDFWANMLVIVKGPFMVRGKDGIVWDLHGRQYMLVSNMLKVGGFLKKTMTSYDAPSKQIFEELNSTEYIPNKRPVLLKGYLWEVIKYVFPIVGSSLKALFNGSESLRLYKEADAEIWKSLHEELAYSNESFDKQTKQALGAFSIMMGVAGGMGASFYAKWRLDRIFKKHKEADDLLVGLSMDLPGNPTSEMGHLMLQIATFPEFQKTKTAEEFFEKLKNKEYSEELINTYNDYVFRFGCRGVREIDIAIPRISENPNQLFFQIKQINVHDNAILKVKKRSKESYEKLLLLAKKIGKEKKFVKLTKVYRSMTGYREHPKYILIVAIGILRKRALKLGKEFVKEGRLEKVEQIFDLTIDQVTEAEKNKELNLLNLVEENIAPYKKVAHITDWPRVIDSRGKIHRVKHESKDGELVGQAIAPGVVCGKAKILHTPYEKSLLKGEILVCKMSEPSWTPVFINASGVVMEIGGPLQHGSIIAREYGLPCVSSLDNATKLIKDGDLIEVDGTNGIVKIINKKDSTKKE